MFSKASFFKMTKGGKKPLSMYSSVKMDLLIVRFVLSRYLSAALNTLNILKIPSRSHKGGEVGDPYGILVHQTARPGDLRSAVVDVLLGGARPPVVDIVDLIEALVLGQRAETVVPLHAAGSVGLCGLAGAMEVLAEAQAAPDRLQAAIYRRR